MSEALKFLSLRITHVGRHFLANKLHIFALKNEDTLHR
jgi:hypothetical protein